MKVQSFFTADTISPISIPILTSTGGEYAHVGLLFTVGYIEFLRLKSKYPCVLWHGVEKDPTGMVRFYFESRSTKDERTGKTGVRGPYPFKKLLDWESDSKHHKLELADMDVKNVEDMIPLLHRSTKNITYAFHQIWQNWMSFRWGRGVPWVKRSRTKWTCSETVVRICAIVDGDFACNTLKLGSHLFVEYAPSSSKGGGIYEYLTKK